MASFEPLEPKTDVSQVWRLKSGSKIRTRTSFTPLQPQNYVAEAQMRPLIFRLGKATIQNLFFNFKFEPILTSKQLHN